MKGVKASVIVLAYNQEATVGRTLDSILSQRADFDFEIIIGEDASSDRTRAVCESYATRFPDRVRLMPPAPNKGIVDNYFDCLMAARGEYVADCAGDDYWLHDRVLHTLADALDEHPEATIAYGLRQDRRGSSKRELRSGRRLMSRQLNSVRRPEITLSAAAYRRETALRALEEDGEMVRNRAFGCEDLPLVLALLCHGEAVRVDMPMLCYDSHKGETPARVSSMLGWFEQELAMRTALARHYGIKKAETAGFQLYGRLRIAKYRLRNIFLRGRGEC